jgi:DNA-binding response OmpR family regulator
MALAACARNAEHGATMQSSLSLVAALPHIADPGGAAGGRRIALWSDTTPGPDAWSQALCGEGLLPMCFDDGTVEPDAIVLHIAHGLSEQLTRLRELRQHNPFTPLVVACLPLRDLDQVLALEMGADDVLDARWGAAVVAARLRALWRRGTAQTTAAATRADSLRFGALSIRVRERLVMHGGQRVPLTEGEFEVLWLLASHAGSALSRREILRRVRGLDDQPLDRSIDSRVYRIRAKLADTDTTQQRIRTVRNRGYVFSPVGW